MPLNLASPGLVVREVDLTIGRVDTATTKAGAIVAPFQKGPVNEPTTIENEQDLIDNFGEPLDIDKHYEYWLTASSYLSYGGILSVVRSDDSDLANAVRYLSFRVAEDQLSRHRPWRARCRAHPPM